MAQATLTGTYKGKLRRTLEGLRAEITAALEADFRAEPGRYNHNFAPITSGCVDTLQAIEAYRVVNTHKM